MLSQAVSSRAFRVTVYLLGISLGIYMFWVG